MYLPAPTLRRPAAVLALQRTAGNRATMAALGLNTPREPKRTIARCGARCTCASCADPRREQEFEDGAVALRGAMLSRSASALGGATVEKSSPDQSIAGNASLIPTSVGRSRMLQRFAGAEWLMGAGAAMLETDAALAPEEAVAGPPGWVVAAGLGILGAAALGVGYALSDTNKPCPPCPPDPPKEIDRVPPSAPHYPCPGDHWHYQRYNQNPQTCQCFLSGRLFGGCCPDPSVPC
jgi:hypothetical protein